MTTTTDRLILREYQLADWQAVHIYARQAEILKYETWGPNTEAETKSFINNSFTERNAKPRRAFELAIILKESAELIGGCGIRINKDKHSRGTLGFIINPNYWNLGYATEAAKGIISFMRREHNVTTVDAVCHALNFQSQKVLEKCGFEKMVKLQNKLENEDKIYRSYLYEKNL